jgi:8-oxo-dGTP diphosphatase
MLQFTLENQFQGENYKIEVFSGDYDNGDVNLISQVYGLVLNKQKQMLIVYHNMGYWILPGGGVEKGETLEQTLHRECYEEAAISLYAESIKPAFYQKIYKQDESGKWVLLTVQMRYFAKLKSADFFENDPDGDILEIKWIDPSDLRNYLDWGEAIDFIQKLIQAQI